MTQREDFEKWAEEKEGLLLWRLVSDDRYESLATEYAFRAWQASRAVALEDAAKVIELYDDKTMEADYMLDSGECAGIIRALKNRP